MLVNADKTNEGGAEDERTSLLSSSSAPPRPTLDRPYNPSHSQEDQRRELEQSGFPEFESRRKSTLSPGALAEMERRAARLAADDALPDTDSVNGLLAGWEVSDDEASMTGDGVGEKKGGVTMEDLEYLAKRESHMSEISGAKKFEAKRVDGDSNSRGSGRGDKETKMVDRIGIELLGAHGDPVAEHRILRKSLRLPTRAHDAEVREGAFRVQSSGDDMGGLAGRVHESTRALRASVGVGVRRSSSGGRVGQGQGVKWVSKGSTGSFHPEIEPGEKEGNSKKRMPAIYLQVASMVMLTIFVMAVLAAAVALGTVAVGPPRQPLGEYKILEAQEGHNFWKYYDFHAGKDSVGSNGYITYVSKDMAQKEGIIEVVTETVPKGKMIEVYEEGDIRSVEDLLAEDMAFLDEHKRKEEDAERKKNSMEGDNDGGKNESESDEVDDPALDGEVEKDKDEKPRTRMIMKDAKHRHLQGIASDLPPPKLEPFNPDVLNPNSTRPVVPTETFVVISSSPTPEGPRNSVRLEGRRRFNRGLFVIDLRHMPGGCGTWPAFWLTDEANWPVNGEIDIVEGVNYQDTAKTALHTTKECVMDDVPEGSKTGSWDTAVGIPDKKTGIPDMTFRYAKNCFVYDPHQWINQGCVATDLKLEGRSLGMPLNANGGGVYALEWDPVNRHIRTWVFSPHQRVPANLRDAMRTATEADEVKRVAPDTNRWGLPYGHFPIGEGTDCPSGHFRNIRLVINLAFCGSVAGNRYFMDCPNQFKEFKTCNAYVKSNPEELKEAYWKIRGVYVFEREWQRQWTRDLGRGKGESD